MREEWHFPAGVETPPQRGAVASRTIAIERRKANHPIELDDGFTSVRFSPDGYKLACGSDDSNILMFDVESGESVEMPNNIIGSVVCCGHTLASGTSLPRQRRERFAIGTPLQGN